jgi:ABC-type sugar transport system ATPase subunit
VSSTPLISLRGVHKRFPGVYALKDVDFEVRAGEVHALVGENGAGKSTLIKIIAGAYALDGGDYLVEGVAAQIESPSESIAKGVVVVYQELELVPSLSVAENIFFGRLPERFGRVQWRRLYAESAALLAQVGLEVDPQTKAGYLGIAAQHLVEIARALSHKAKLIVMDEPTSALSPQEIARLLKLIGALKERGVGIVYVSHKLDEVLQIADRITVLRDGGCVACKEAAGLDEQSLVSLMVGRALGANFTERKAKLGAPALEVEKLSSAAVNDISFVVRAGEIVGFSGLMGAGRTELARALMGVDRRLAGQVRVGGTLLPASSPVTSRRLGMGLVPEDRRESGIFPRRSVSDNASIAALENLSTLGRIRHKAEREQVGKWVERLAVRTPNIEQEIAKLSGGNQQKVLLARWLLVENIKVLIVDEPTRGIDVGAKAEIYSLLNELAEGGLALVVMSSEMTEILGLCDCIHVLRAGRLTASYTRGEATAENLLKSALPVSSASLYKKDGENYDVVDGQK